MTLLAAAEIQQDYHKKAAETFQGLISQLNSV